MYISYISQRHKYIVKSTTSMETDQNLELIRGGACYYLPTCSTPYMLTSVLKPSNTQYQLYRYLRALDALHVPTYLHTYIDTSKVRAREVVVSSKVVCDVTGSPQVSSLSLVVPTSTALFTNWPFNPFKHSRSFTLHRPSLHPPSDHRTVNRRQEQLFCLTCL